MKKCYGYSELNCPVVIYVDVYTDIYIYTIRTKSESNSNEQILAIKINGSDVAKPHGQKIGNKRGKKIRS